MRQEDPQERPQDYQPRAKRRKMETKDIRSYLIVRRKDEGLVEEEEEGEDQGKVESEDDHDNVSRTEGDVEQDQDKDGEPGDDKDDKDDDLVDKDDSGEEGRPSLLRGSIASRPNRRGLTGVKMTG